MKMFVHENEVVPLKGLFTQKCMFVTFMSFKFHMSFMSVEHRQNV